MRRILTGEKGFKHFVMYAVNLNGFSDLYFLLFRHGQLFWFNFFLTHVLKDLTVLLTHTLSVKSEVLCPEYEQTQDFSITVLSIKVVNCMCF